VNFHKTQLLTATILGLLVSKSLAQSPIFIVGEAETGSPVEFVLRVNANYRQNPFSVDFTGGQHLVFVRDGQVAYDGCRAPFFFPPTTDCPLGSTGFLSGGDINGDGIDDGGTYLSVTQVAAAQLIEPARPDKVLLVSAPPTGLPRPSAGFANTSALLFFNIRTPVIRQFKMSQYFFNRVYTAGQRTQFDDNFVQGTYRYAFPVVNKPTVPFTVDFNYFGGIDGFREVNNQKRGFRFNGFTFVGGFAQIDPSVPNTVRWQGNTADKVSLTSDRATFSIQPLLVPGDPLSDPDLAATPIFPPFAAPGVIEVTLPTPVTMEYNLPPGLIPLGTTGLLKVTIVRNRGTVVSDRSITSFSVPVQFQPPGSPAIVAAIFIASKLPPTATVADKAYNNDYDGDGVSNFAEWVFNSDPGSASSVPVAPRLAFEAPEAGTVISTKADGSSGSWVFRVAKRENADPALTYAIERSTDMNEWIKVTKDDPNWNLVETASEIKVVSRTSELNGGNFFRACAEAVK